MDRLTPTSSPTRGGSSSLARVQDPLLNSGSRSEGVDVSVDTISEAWRRLLLAGGAAGLGLVSGTAVTLVQSTPASAGSLGSPCATNHGAEFEGYTNIPLGSAAGASTIVDHHEPVNCTGQTGSNPSESATWAMIWNQYGSGLAQEGWVKNAAWSTDTVYFFWECNSCNAVDGEPLAAVPNEFAAVGDSSNFDYQDQFITLDYGTVILMEIQPYIDPDLTSDLTAYGVPVHWTPTTDQWAGEIHWDETEVPGTPSHKCYFYDVSEWSTSTQSFEPVDLSNVDQLDTATYGDIYDVNASEFRIYDTRGS